MKADAGALLETDGKIIGMAGILSPEFAERWEIRQEVAVAEIDLELATDPPLAQFEALARFPSVTVDTTVEHPAALSFAELESAVRDLAGEWVADIRHEARYLPGGDVVRTTLRFVYRHPERSLTQDEVNAAHEDLRQDLAKRLGITFA